MKPICNYCGYLVKKHNGEDKRFFNACCSKKVIETNSVKRPMVIEFDAGEMFDIERPNWCPIQNMSDSQLALPSQSQTAALPKNLENGKEKKFKDMSYTEKREEFKKLPKRLEWDDIKEGHYYLIPKIMSTPRKILHVEMKTNACLRCHEISEYSGSEFSYATNIYPNEIEAVMIVELHNY